MTYLGASCQGTSWRSARIINHGVSFMAGDNRVYKLVGASTCPGYSLLHFDLQAKFFSWLKQSKYYLLFNVVFTSDGALLLRRFAGSNPCVPRRFYQICYQGKNIIVTVIVELSWLWLYASVWPLSMQLPIAVLHVTTQITASLECQVSE